MQIIAGYSVTSTLKKTQIKSCRDYASRQLKKINSIAEASRAQTILEFSF